MKKHMFKICLVLFITSILYLAYYHLHLLDVAKTDYDVTYAGIYGLIALPVCFFSLFFMLSHRLFRNATMHWSSTVRHLLFYVTLGIFLCDVGLALVGLLWHMALFPFLFKIPPYLFAFAGWLNALFLKETMPE